MNNLEYYKNKKNSEVIKYLKEYNLYHEGNFDSEDIKLLIFLIIYKFKLDNKEIMEKVLKELFENYRYDRDYEFDKYFKYKNIFILKLLLLYKNKILFSKQDFKLLLIKEKENNSNSIINFNVKNNYYEEGLFDYNDTLTPLHMASACRNKDIMKLLIDYGADVNKKNNKGITPLMHLCQMRSSYISEVKLLINYNANIKSSDKNGNSLLHLICNRGIYYTENDKLLIYLINLGLNVNKLNNEGNTPLMELRCYSYHSFDAIKIFVENGADLNIRNNKGETAFFIACKYGLDFMAKALNNHGANVHIADNEGNTPLLIVCEKMRDKVINNDIIGISDYIAILDIFIDTEKMCDVNVSNNKGETPLMKLACVELYELSEYLIKHGANVNAKDNEGNTPLSIAKAYNEKKTINCLIKYGAFLN